MDGEIGIGAGRGEEALMGAALGRVELVGGTNRPASG
jgi:hypothetical protein